MEYIEFIHFGESNMVIYLFSDKAFEQQSILCIKSIYKRIPEDAKIVYFTIGFNSDFEMKNLYKYYVDYNPKFDKFTYYKPDLSLKVMSLFPNDFYIYSDSDILFSSKFSVDKVLNTSLPYPLASFGPHEYPFTFDDIGESRIYYNEVLLMNYFNVPERSMRYVWACLFSFNPQCKDFFEEWSSMVNNGYLFDRRKYYFPFYDETPFNICLWKRKADKSLGYAFLNTHRADMVIKCEKTHNIQNEYGHNYDLLGVDWEHIVDSENIIFYHGFKDEMETSTAVNFLLTR